jgi:hypothetical protein
MNGKDTERHLQGKCLSAETNESTSSEISRSRVTRRQEFERTEVRMQDGRAWPILLFTKEENRRNRTSQMIEAR